MLFQAVWKFQYGFQQIIDHVFVRALAMPSCFVSWIPIGHCFQRDHPLKLRPNLLWSEKFILWHLWESENQHSLSTVVKCQIFGRFIINVQRALSWRKILFSLPINITNNTNFYRLKKIVLPIQFCVIEFRIGHVTPVHGIWMTDYLFIRMHNTFNLSYKLFISQYFMYIKEYIRY